MATCGSLTTVPCEDRRWAKLAGVIKGSRTQIPPLPDTSGRQDEKVGGLERAAQSVQALVQSLSQQEGLKQDPEESASKRTVWWERTCCPNGWRTGRPSSSGAAGVYDERFKAFLKWAEAQDANAPVVDPTANGIAGAMMLSQHPSASL